MSEESFDIPSEHNVKSVIKRTQMRGPRCNSSILCTDKGAIKSEDRESFGLVEKTSHSSRVFGNVKEGLQEIVQFMKVPKVNRLRKLSSRKTAQSSEVSQSPFRESQLLMTYHQNLYSSKMNLVSEDSSDREKSVSIMEEKQEREDMTFMDQRIK
jgi:hypothetical protein